MPKIKNHRFLTIFSLNSHSTDRFYVHRSIYAEFASKLTRKVSELKIGSGFEDGSSIGPLIDQRSLDKVSRHVRMAKESGAEVLIGGKKLDGAGYFFEPTVLSEVQSGVIDHEETFGESFRMNLSMCLCKPVINITYF